MTFPVDTYPLMRRNAIAAARASGIRAAAVDARFVVTQAADGETTSITWRDLLRAANQADTELADIYAGLYLEAAEMLRALPLAEQGLEIFVTSRTGGATWAVGVYDAALQYRRDLMRADDGVDEPQQSQAIATAREIQGRLQKRGANVQVSTYHV